MHDEAGFLSAIRQTPADDIARLVYADWLDEQDDLICKQKSDFIRLELRMANEASDDYTALAVRLQILAAQLDPDWLVLVSRPRVEGCELLADRECPTLWSRLAPTGDPCLRSCSECRRPVRYVRWLAEAAIYRARGTRFVVALNVVRRTETAWCPPVEEIVQELRLRVEPSHYAQRCQARTAPAKPDVTDGDPAIGGRPQPRPRRQKKRHRNIERENWEADE
jgi:uncharacterized protein (TIGR02996 family)